jgi:hypothetical protein
MYVPPFMRHRRDEDGRKQPRQRPDSEDDGEDDHDDGGDVDDEDHQQQEHRTRCFGSNSLLLLLSMLLTLAVIGSGFLFANILSTGSIIRSGETARPITIGNANANTNTNTNTISNINTNTNGYNLSIVTSTAEDVASFVKDIYRELLRKYTTTMTNDGGVYADGDFEKDDTITEESLERELNYLGNVNDKDKDKGYRKLKQKNNKKSKNSKTKRPKAKKTKPPKPFASVNGLTASPKSSLSKKDLINDLIRVTKEILSIDGVIQSSNPLNDCIVKVIIPRKTNCNNIYSSAEDIPDDVSDTCYEYKIMITGSNADDAIELVAKELLSDNYTTDLGYRVLLEPSPEAEIGMVEVLAAPIKISKNKLINELTIVINEILNIDDVIQSSNPYGDSTVKIIIQDKTDCNNIYSSAEDIPNNVKKCYDCKIIISGSNADDAIKLVTKEISSDDYTTDLGTVLILKPVFVPYTASVNGLAAPPNGGVSKKALKNSITRVTNGILGFGGALSSSNPYKDCVVKCVIPKTTDCKNIYQSENIPEEVKKCYEYSISIMDNGGGTCNTKKAMELITNDINSDEYTTDLGFEVIIDPKGYVTIQQGGC